MISRASVHGLRARPGARSAQCCRSEARHAGPMGMSGDSRVRDSRRRNSRTSEPHWSAADRLQLCAEETGLTHDAAACSARHCALTFGPGWSRGATRATHARTPAVNPTQSTLMSDIAPGQDINSPARQHGPCAHWRTAPPRNSTRTHHGRGELAKRRERLSRLTSASVHS